MKKGIGNVIMNVFVIIGILCISYFLMYMIFVDLTNVFTYFWLILGVACLFVKPVANYIVRKNITIPAGVKWGCLIGITTLMLVFLITEAIIIGYATHKPQPNADYVLVLGAQVKGKNPTYALQARLNTAYEYALDNPDTILILSGGKGPGEDVTEAYAMAEYLKNKGLNEGRMILEEQSTSTYENVLYSKELMISPDATVVLVTNHFHVFRGVGVAKKQGLTQVEGLGAPTKWYTIPNQYVREAFAVIKYKLCGQI